LKAFKLTAIASDIEAMLEVRGGTIEIREGRQSLQKDAGLFLPAGVAVRRRSPEVILQESRKVDL
jgi:hypothetical protein